MMQNLISKNSFNTTNLLTTGNGIVGLVSAGFGTFISTVYGVGPDRKTVIGILLILIAMDWMSGIGAARKDATYSSQYGINVASLRTLYILCFPALGNLLDMWLSTPGPGVIFMGLTGGLCYHYWQSMTANAYRAGWKRWIPEKVISHVSSEIEAKTIRAEETKEKRKEAKSKIS